MEESDGIVVRNSKGVYTVCWRYCPKLARSGRTPMLWTLASRSICTRHVRTVFLQEHREVSQEALTAVRIRTELSWWVEERAEACSRLGDLSTMSAQMLCSRSSLSDLSD